MKKFSVILLIIFALWTVFTLNTQSHSTETMNDKKNYTYVEINKYDYNKKLLYKTVKKYNNKQNIIERKNYTVYEGDLKMVSVDKFIYDNNTGLLKEEARRSPNLGVVFQITFYKYEKKHGAYRIVEKRYIDYLNSTITMTEYEYEVGSNRLTAEKVMLLNSDKQKYIAEKEFCYNNKGQISQIIEYKDNNENSNIYDVNYVKYQYNKDTSLIEKIRTFDGNNEPESVIIVVYDDENRISKEIIYKPEIVLSENDMYFERRFVKENVIDYTYHD